MRGKEIYLAGGGEEGAIWEIFQNVGITGLLRPSHIKTKEANKIRIRQQDWRWVKHNLGNFGGVYEIHHDWEHGANMYLLTKEEHIAVERAGVSGGD